MRRSLILSIFCMQVAIGVTLYASTAMGGVVCPNESLRAETRSSQLPECRAYERVTPAYKESGIIAGAFAISPDGSRVIVGSLGTFAGAEQGAAGLSSHTNGATYVLARTPAGWTDTSITPAASSHTSFGLFDASRSLEASLWELTATPRSAPATSAGVEPFSTSLYIEQKHGVFENVGPETPPTAGPNDGNYTYLGASEDLSHIVFSTPAGLRWPFDQTTAGGSTLYAYIGVEQPGESASRQPALVGVNEDDQLISSCGTRLGSNRGSVYNAISASGRRIFFTSVGTEEVSESCEGPRFGEIYAREEVPLMEGELPAAGMRTVAISEPSKEDCSACLTEPEAVRAPAIFQGASRDGSRVFFTTEQELLPGAQGNNLYEYSFDAPAGERVTLLSACPAEPAAVQGVARVSEDGSHVYFVAHGDLTGSATNSVGVSANAGEDNLYVYFEDHVAFVASLSPADFGDWAQADNRPVLASEDGNLLIFTSVADLTHEGLELGKHQVFQYNASSGLLARASIGQQGFNDDNRNPNEGSAIVSSLLTAYSYESVDSPASAAGVQAPADEAVFFSSPDALTPYALTDKRVSMSTNAGIEEVSIPNIYEYHAGSVVLLSGGDDTSVLGGFSGTYLFGTDPNGADVFFFTSSSLIPADTDTQQDLYDARVNGGFPTPTSLPGCIGETCQGGLTSAPVLTPLGGSAVQVAESEAPPPSVPIAAKAAPKKVTKHTKTRVKRHKKTKAKAGERALGTSRKSKAGRRMVR
jgi:hypothetical protein